MATKSLLRRARIDTAPVAHNCKANRGHRLERGDRRVTVHRGNSSQEHYCLRCAVRMVEQDIATLKGLYDALAAP